MSPRNVFFAALAMAGLSTIVVPAAAQDAPAAPQDSAGTTTVTGGQVVATGREARPEDNWVKICDTLDDGQKACLMRQLVLRNKQFFGSFVLRDDPGQKSRLVAVAAAPLGVMLPFGMTWQIDGSKPIRVPFMLCDRTSCITQLVINEAYVNSLKKGAILKLTAKNRQNKDLTIEINLAGFTAVYDGDSALTPDQFQQQASGQSALEQMLQDRAEQIRSDKDGPEDPPPTQ